MIKLFYKCLPILRNCKTPADVISLPGSYYFHQKGNFSIQLLSTRKVLHTLNNLMHLKFLTLLKKSHASKNYPILKYLGTCKSCNLILF